MMNYVDDISTTLRRITASTAFMTPDERKRLADYMRKSDPGFNKVLDQLERTDPDDPLVQGALGNRDLHAGKYQEAVERLQHAIKGGATKTVLYTDLADALVKLDRASEAVQVLKQAAERDPFNAELRKRLIVQLIQVKDYANARAQMDDYVQLFPADSFMRQLLARVQSMGQPK